MHEEISLDGRSITLEQVAAIARHRAQVTVTPEAMARVARSRALVDQRLASGDVAYGINTGFGYLSRVRIDDAQLSELQKNLVRSHACGVGPALSPEATRVLMFLRANVLATGRSGATPAPLEMLTTFINRDILPVIPSKGSVGASGDLAPLAHLALALIGEGEIWRDGQRVPSAEVLKAENLTPLALAPKEGLCLVNGTQVMAALGALAVLEVAELVKVADLAGACTLEGCLGTPVAFDALIQDARPHPGQSTVAENLRRLVAESAIIESHADCDRVQDPYSLRCMPQVHGATRDGLAFVETVLSREFNSATDNPLVFAEAGEGDRIMSGGNFHGQPLALALDFLAMGTAELANISDRRVEQLIDPGLSGLPAFLTPDPGLNSGFMMAQVTSAALVNENRVLCTPASVDSIPTSANREDHVSMGMTSARKVLEIIDNVRTCLAIELLCASQAIDLRGLAPGLGTGAAHRAIRADVPQLRQDRILSHDIETVRRHIADGTLLKAVESAIGPLA